MRILNVISLIGFLSNFHVNSAATSPVILPADLMITAFAENYSQYWIGTNKGIYSISKKDGSRRHLTRRNSQLPHDYITSIAVDSKGYVYVGTIKGLLIWNRSSFYQVTTLNSNLPDNCITSMAIDPYDQLWIGTYYEGLIKGSDKIPITFESHPIESNSDKIYSLSFDQQANLWVGFYDARTAVLSNGKWDIYGVSQPLEKIFPGEGVPFLVSTTGAGTYFAGGSSFKNIADNYTCNTKTCSYFNPETNRLIVCYENSVFVYDPQDTDCIPVEISIADYIASLRKPNLKQPSGKSRDITGDLFTLLNHDTWLK